MAPKYRVMSANKFAKFILYVKSWKFSIYWSLLRLLGCIDKERIFYLWKTVGGKNGATIAVAHETHKIYTHNPWQVFS